MITQIKYPSRAKGLMAAVIFSVLAHAAILLAIRVAPIVRIAMGFGGIEWVDDPKYNKAIIIDTSKWLIYPDGYLGFGRPQKTRSLDEMKKEESRRRRLEERMKREQELAKKREAEERAKAEEEAKAKLAKAEPTPTPRSRPPSGRLDAP